MKIVTLSVSNFKRIKDLTITPDADRALILIGGRNGQGKSSLIDALTAAFGGKKSQPQDPVRHGADEAEIVIKLDNGLTIRRTITPDGDSKLEVRDELGARKAPQQMLDGLVNGRFLDPLAFLALPAKEQRAALMKLIPNADRIAELDGKRERCFSKRTEVGRDLTRAQGELERLPEVQVGTPIDVAALTTEAKRLDLQWRQVDTLTQACDACERDTTNAKARLAEINAERAKVDAEIERLKARSVQLGIESADWAKDVETCSATEANATVALDAAQDERDNLRPLREQIDADLARAGEHNRKVYADEANNKRRTETAETVTALTKEVDELTKVLSTIDARKLAILTEAKLPVAGLSINDHGITLNDVPFVQASGAERLRVALGLAMAAAPQLEDVWIRDGALLDEESLELVATQAIAAGKRPWIELVGTKEPGVIVIQDGQVAS